MFYTNFVGYSIVQCTVMGIFICKHLSPCLVSKKRNKLMYTIIIKFVHIK